MFKFAVFVPSTGAESFVVEDVLNGVKVNFAHFFGGFTVVEANGGWVSPSGELIEEKVHIVGSVVGCENAPAILGSIAGEIKSMLSQESVLIIVDGDPLFV